MPKRKRPDLTPEQCREIWEYDPELPSGLAWKEYGAGTKNYRARVRMAGSFSWQNGWKVCYGGYRYAVNKIIWMICKSNVPSHHLIHLNGDRRDNRIENLRDAKTDENAKRGLEHLKSRVRLVGGELVWRRPPKGSRQGDKVRTSTFQTGYRCFRIDEHYYRLHVVIFALHHDRWPTLDIDHINGDPSDNRLENLREATRSQNIANGKKPKNNTSGRKGVFWNRQAQKWNARIKVRGKNIHLGLFNDLDEAASAYEKAAIKYFGEFARTE